MKLERTWVLLLAGSLGCSSPEPIAEPETQDQGEITIGPGPTPPPSPAVQATPAGVKVITNSIGMKLALIPAGEFMMGSPDSDLDASGDEKPQHQVRISKAFYLGVTEVTQDQYEEGDGAESKPFHGIGPRCARGERVLG